MVVELAALALFNRIAGGHYLFATAAAVELTLFHNFLWHLHTTWGDRCNGCNHSTQAGKLFRFHLSNGLVSMIGNLAIMSTHVHGAHVPLLAANLVAILTCSLVNFCLANQWVF